MKSKIAFLIIYLIVLPIAAWHFNCGGGDGDDPEFTEGAPLSDEDINSTNYDINSDGDPKYGGAVIDSKYGAPVITNSSGYIRGIILDNEKGTPISGVGILVKDVAGGLRTAKNGTFAFPVETPRSSQKFMVNMTRPDYTPAHRIVRAINTRSSTVSTIFLTKSDVKVTEIGAKGGVHKNSSGTIKIKVPAGTVIESTDFAATQYMAGKTLPGTLPESSFFTYAIELSAGNSNGEVHEFGKPIPVRLKNDRGFAVGSIIPVGYFDKETAQWKQDSAGKVSDDGKWIDFEVQHFSPYDVNYPIIAPEGSDRPSLVQSQTSDSSGTGASMCGTSEIKLESGDLVQTYDLPGYRIMGQEQRLSLKYQSSTVDTWVLITYTNRPVSGTLSPVQVGFKAEFEGTEREIRYDSDIPEASEDNEEARFVMKAAFPAKNFEGEYLSTGLYDYMAEITYYYRGTYGKASCFGCPSEGSTGVEADELMPRKATTSDVVVVNNQINGSYGSGWSVSAVKRIFKTPGRKELLLVDGNGVAIPFEPDGELWDIAGDGKAKTSGDGGNALDASVNEPTGLAMDSSGNLYVVEHEGNVVRKIDIDGIITTVAGSGSSGYLGDGEKATSARLQSPTDVDVDSAGNLYIADDLNSVIRKVDKTGIITTFAGNGKFEYSGDGGMATDAGLKRPSSVTIDNNGNFYIADSAAHVVRKISATGIISTFAGNGVSGNSGDLGKATDAMLTSPHDVAIDSEGNVYIADAGAHVIRKVDPTGIITTFAGTGKPGFSGDGEVATKAEFNGPRDIEIDADDELYITDTFNDRIRKINTDGVVTTIAGGDQADADGQLVGPTGLAIDASGGVYIADTMKHRVRTIRGMRYVNRTGAPLNLIRNGDTFTITDMDGNEEIFDKDGRQTLFKDKNGNQASFSYDDKGRLGSIKDVLGQTTTLSYDSSGYLSDIKDPQGRSTKFNINSSGDLIEITETDGSKWAYAYDSNHKMTSKTDPRGYVTTYTYDEYGKVAQTNSPNGEVRTYDTAWKRGLLKDGEGTEDKLAQYETLGSLVTEYIDGEGNTHTYRFDKRGNITFYQDPLGNKTQITRDAASRPLLATLPNGEEIEYKYNQRGLLVSKELLGLKSATTFAYDENNRLVSVADAEGSKTTFEYDGKGNLKKKTDALGNVTSFEYYMDLWGAQKLIYGILKSATDPLGNKTTFNYDSKIMPSSVVDPLGNTVGYSYDAAGNLTLLVDGNGNATDIAYDLHNRAVQIIDPSDKVTKYVYKFSGCGCAKDNLLTQIIDPAGHAWSFDYNEVGKLTSVVDPLGGKQSWTYNYNRDVATYTNRNGQKASYKYDDAGHLIEINRPNDVAQYEYDELGNMIYAKDNDSTLSMMYGSYGLLTGVDVGGIDMAIDYSYDKVGRVVEKSASLGKLNFSGSYSYDLAGQLFSYTDNDSNNYIFLNDNAGKLAGIILPDGHIREYEYDNASRLTGVYNYAGGKAVSSSQYTYDKAGNRTALSDNWGDRVFGYDVLDRLLSATNSSEAYTYDVVGNRLTGPNGEKYTYDSANRLIGISGPVSATFTYDADGNLTSQTVNGVPTAYTWNSVGQLVSVTKDGKTVTFSYDVLGRRIGKTADGKSTAFVYDGAEVTFALDATDPEKKPGGYFVHGPGIDNHLAAVFGDTPDSGEHYYYHVDGLGSVTAVTNGAGKEVATNRYDSFGKLVAQTGSLPFASTYTYTGREWDAEAGLYYYRARYYDPSLGRFISEDPIGFAGGTNFYAYVENNPLKWVDPWGLILTYADIASENAMKPHIQQMMRTPVGRELLKQLHSDPQTYLIHSGFDNQGDTNYRQGNDVYVDPNSNISFQSDCGTKKFSIPRILAHELGHLTGVRDDGLSKMNNVNAWENPIMYPLEGYNRTQY